MDDDDDDDESGGGGGRKRTTTLPPPTTTHLVAKVSLGGKLVSLRDPLARATLDKVVDCVLVGGAVAGAPHAPHGSLVDLRALAAARLAGPRRGALVAHAAAHLGKGVLERAAELPFGIVLLA